MKDLTKWVRTELGLSQADMAELLRVDARSVSAWEAGKSEPNALARGCLFGIRAAISENNTEIAKRRIKNTLGIGGIPYLVMNYCRQEGITDWMSKDFSTSEGEQER